MNLTTLSKGLTAVFLLASLLFGCNSKSTDSEEADSSRIVSQIQDMGSAPVAPTAPFFLDSLLIKDSIFVANKNKNFVFEYYVGDSSVTLHGWLLKNTNGGSGQYDPTPDVKLLPQGKTGVSIGVGTTIGNQVLTKKVVKAITDYINANKPAPSSKANLRFKPALNSAGHIYYKITVEFPILGPQPGVLPSQNFETNPSPPHQGFE